jgi:RNA polymerase sigma-70 factor (ECF subfamily)
MSSLDGTLEGQGNALGEDLSQPEVSILAALAKGDLDTAAVATLRGYGPEILGFLVAELGNEQHAEEVFSTFAEDLWRALPGLSLRTTMRAYAYSLARHAKHRFLDRDLRKQRRAVPLSQVEELSKIVHAARTATPVYQESAAQQRLAALRERLSAEERALLTLRVDRGLEWREIAEVLAGEEADQTRAMARLRKRFQLTKDKLTQWAREEGLLPRDE